MTKTAKVLLSLGILCLVVGGIFNLGWINAGNLDALYAIFPVGAVFLGLFLIELVLEKERMKHDADHLHTGPAEKPSDKAAPPSGSSPKPQPGSQPNRSPE